MGLIITNAFHSNVVGRTSSRSEVRWEVKVAAGETESVTYARSYYE